jgi:peptidoglycan/LPS O-acetylase OafA/YrhL
MGYIPAIDGMRAVAILLVISSHLGADRLVPGGFGVTLFFFISGYLITHLMIGECSKNGSISIRRFYLRRFLRLMPALVVMITVVSTSFYLLRPVPVAQILAASLYYMNYYTLSVGGPPSPFGPMWSLAVEEHYYLLFPILFALGWRTPKGFLLALVTVATTVLLWRCVLVLHYQVAESRTYLATDTRIDSILFGAMLATIYVIYPEILAVASRFWWPIGLTAILFSFVFRNEVFRETLRYSLQGIALIPLFYAILNNRSLHFGKVLLEAPLAIWIGKISYSLYLWHFAVLLFADIEFGIRNWTWLSFNIVADILLACGSYYLIERNFNNLRARLHAGGQQFVPPLNAQIPL